MNDTERESDVDAALEAALALHTFFKPQRPGVLTAIARKDFHDALRRLEDGSIPLTEKGDPPALQE